MSGDLGNLPSSAPRDGDSDLTSCVRPGGIVPPDPWGYRPARPSPHRRGSSRAGRVDPHARSRRDGPVPIELEHDCALTPSCVPS